MSCAEICDLREIKEKRENIRVYAVWYCSLHSCYKNLVAYIFHTFYLMIHFHIIMGLHTKPQISLPIIP